MANQVLHLEIMSARICLIAACATSIITSAILTVSGLMASSSPVPLNVGRVTAWLVFITAMIGMSAGLSMVVKLNEKFHETLAVEMKLGVAGLLAIVAVLHAALGLIALQFVKRQHE